MRHALITEGYGIRLRPVALEDSGFIVWLRNLAHIAARVNDSARNVAAQNQWLADYFERDGDYYFLVETLDAVPLGTYSMYNRLGETAEIGRLAIRPGVPAANAACLLIFDLFYGLGLTSIRASAAINNLTMQSYLRKAGFQNAGTQPGGSLIQGERVDLLRFVQTAARWSKCRERFRTGAERDQSRIRRWQKSLGPVC